MQKVIYSPSGKKISDGSKEINDFHSMAYELVSSKELIVRWFLRDFKVRYRQTMLGVIWAVLMPLITVGIFLMMNQSGIFNFGETKVPYSIYALTGLAVWGIFATGLSGASRSLVDVGSMLIKINFPKISIVIASTLHAFIDFVIKLIIVSVLFIYYGVVPSSGGLIWSFFGLVGIYCLTLALGLFFSILSGVFRDIPNMLGVALMLLMFVTPVLFVADVSSFVWKINTYNPLNCLVNGFRSYFLFGEYMFWKSYFVSIVGSFGLLLVAWRGFYIVQMKIAERL